MTSRERFQKVFRGERPDRLPVTLHMFDHARFVTQLYPQVDPLDYATINLKSVEIARQLGADVFARMLYDAHDPISIFMGGLDVSQQTESWEVRTDGNPGRQHPGQALHHPHPRGDADPGLRRQPPPGRPGDARLHGQADPHARRPGARHPLRTAPQGLVPQLAAAAGGPAQGGHRG